MANAAVDKLKDFGLRHGEKVVFGLTATLFVVFTVLAIAKPTLDMKPEQLNTAASQASSNLSKQQDVKDILAKLDKDGLKEPNFQKSSMTSSPVPCRRIVSEPSSTGSLPSREPA